MLFPNELIFSVIYLASCIILLMCGKFVFDLTYCRCNLKEELIERDNLALSLSVGGYLIGISIAVGGALSGSSVSLWADLKGIFLYGIIAILLLNLSVRINDWLILSRVDALKEVLQEQNCGVGIIEAANHIAMGLIIYGIISGEGGGLLAILVFWVLGQLTLIAAARIYGWIVHYDVQSALEQNNVAVGTAFAGMLIGIGNIVRIAEQGEFISWSHSLFSYAIFVAFGLLALPVVRLITDVLILPGRRLTQELVRQDRANVGAGVIEAVSYISTSILIGWCIS